jgi:hypothetical protein
MPEYAPEINAVELLNNDLKTNWVGPLRPRDKEEMRQAVEGYREVLEECPQLVQSFFQAENTRYILDEKEPTP